MLKLTRNFSRFGSIWGFAALLTLSLLTTAPSPVSAMTPDEAPVSEKRLERLMIPNPPEYPEDARWEDNKWFEDMSNKNMYWIWLLSTVACLSDCYFDYVPVSVEDMVDKGLTPYAPQKWDTDRIDFLNRFFVEQGYSDYQTNRYWLDNEPSLSELRNSVTKTRLNDAGPQTILEYRLQVLARMPKSHGTKDALNDKAIFFRYGDFPHFPYSVTHTVYSDASGLSGRRVKEFWTNPYTGDKAKFGVIPEIEVKKGDILIMPATEYIRTRRPELIDDISEYYYLYVLIWLTDE
ncbi:hypothetical protein J7K50_06985 [bacterium]|nr:hypothetical protein [bacterium]